MHNFCNESNSNRASQAVCNDYCLLPLPPTAWQAPKLSEKFLVFENRSQGNSLV